MATKRLTKVSVEALGKRSAAYVTWDTGAGAVTGFGVKVLPSGRRIAVFQYRLKGAGRRGKTKRFTIGEIAETGALKFAEAKRRAERLRGMVLNGQDPVHDTKAQALASVQLEKEAKERTFRALADAWLKKKSALRSKAELGRIIESDDLKPIHRRGVAALTPAELDAIISGIEERAPTMAARTLQVVQWVFQHGIKRGWITTNPAEHLEVTSETRGGRDRVLTDDELVAIWNAADRMAQNGRWQFGRSVQLLMLTAARRSEVVGMDWSEIDQSESVWRLPAERAKNGEAHDAHLAKQSLAILSGHESVKGGKFPRAGLLFTTNGKRPISGLSKYKAALDEILLAQAREKNPRAKITPWRLHDLRRTAATAMAGMGFQLPVVERVLNHRGVSRTGVAGIYIRAEFKDERRAALDAWAERVSALVRGVKPKGNVIAMGRS